MVLVGFDGVQALDLIGPFDVVTGANLCLGRQDDGYVLTIASANGRSVSTGTGPARRDEKLLAWVGQVHDGASWTASVCSGSVILAAAGLLEGKPPRTGWRCRR